MDLNTEHAKPSERKKGALMMPVHSIQWEVDPWCVKQANEQINDKPIGQKQRQQGTARGEWHTGG